jgi:hypothetical protein
MYPFFALKSPLLLYPFRYFDPVRKRWIRARYVAERHVIESSYARWEITGPAEIRTPIEGWLNPFRRSTMYSAHLPMNGQSPVEQSSIDDELERFLVLLFLRRYVTYCARRRRYAQMEGAARLHQKVVAR